MFLKIEINSATLCINLGSDLSKAEDLVKMFEDNAVVVDDSYRSLVTVKPEANIVLGNEIKFKKQCFDEPEYELIVTSESEVTGAVNADANVFVYINAIKEKAREMADNYKKEIASLQRKLDEAEEVIEALKTKTDETV